MSNPPLDPKDATAHLAAEMAEALAETLLELIRDGHAPRDAVINALTARLQDHAQGRLAVARQHLLGHALLRLAGSAAGSSRA